MNSITGAKPALLLGTKSISKVSNLAIFSSIVHISSSPALFAFFIRNTKNHRRDTFNNILETKCYTFNHINSKIIKQSHETSYKYSEDVSEFKECGFTEEYVNNFHAPYVKESNIKIGLELREVVDFSFTTSKLIVGELVYASFCEKYITKNKILNLENSESVFVSGLNDYYLPKKIASYPYVRK